MKIHQTSIFVSLDRPSAARGKGTGLGRDGADQLCFAILARYDRDQVRASWRDGEGGRLESVLGEIAVEVITTAEIIYHEDCRRAFEWRVRRKARLEEDAQIINCSSSARGESAGSNSNRQGSSGSSMRRHRCAGRATENGGGAEVRMRRLGKR
jgi:hypothetical protein